MILLKYRVVQQYDSIEMFKVYDVTIKSNTVQNVSELIDCRCDVFI